MSSGVPRKATLPREKWTYVNMAKELADQVDEIVNAQKHGYRSRSEFVSDAIRRRMDELRESAKSKKMSK